MKRYILPKSGFLILFGIISIIVALQIGVATVIKDVTFVANGPCTFKSWSKSDHKLIMKLDCNGRETSTSDPEVITYYIEKRGPLNWSTWASGKAYCKVKDG